MAGRRKSVENHQRVVYRKFLGEFGEVERSPPVFSFANKRPANPVLQPEFKYGVVALRVPADNLLAFLVLPGLFGKCGGVALLDFQGKQRGFVACIGERRVIV